MPENPVGQQPESQQEIEEVATLFEERGALTEPGSLVEEPSFEYIHSSATRVAIEGFTIIPAVAIGLINVSELQRDTLIGAVAFRYGLSKRLEIGSKIPYVYRSESVREREINTGSTADVIRDSEGNDLGDLEFALHYQFNRTGSPIFIGNVRTKTRTGTDPFEVKREQLLAEDGTPIGEVFTEQPTGSGFWGVQPSITMIYPSDPAVLFANVSYLWNIKRDLGGMTGEVDPGDIVGLSFGLGFSVNDRTSFSIGYDHNVVFKSDIENDAGLEPVFDQIQVGTLLLGASQRLSKRANFTLSLGVGVTESAPDLQLAFRFPLRML
jgi:hypothetical protein